MNEWMNGMQGQDDMQHKLDDLTKGVVMYKFLGLEFERASNDQLQIRFTHIDVRQSQSASQPATHQSDGLVRSFVNSFVNSFVRSFIR